MDLLVVGFSFGSFFPHAQKSVANLIHKLANLPLPTVAACFAALLLAILLFQLRRSSLSLFIPRKKIQIPRGSFGLPFLGETLLYVRGQRQNNVVHFYKSRVAKYGETFTTHLLGEPTIAMTTPAAYKLLAVNENKLVATSWPSSVIAVMGKESVLAKTGDEAKRLRSAFSTFLKTDALQVLLTRVESITKMHLDRYWEGKEQLIVYPTMKRFVFSLACSLFWGRDDEEEQQILQQTYNTFTKGLASLPLNVPGTPYYRAKAAAGVLREYFGRWMEQRRKEMKDGTVSAHDDFLSYLLIFKDKTGKPLTDECIKDNILFLLFAGSDTTSQTLTMLCKYLAENPILCQNVLEEHQRIASSKTPGDPLNWEDIQKMQISWRNVQETLRLQGPGQMGFHKVLEEFDFDGCRIPKGWKVHWSVNCTHFNPKYFPDPEMFDPDRFKGAGPTPYTFLPFGLGPRMCPGVEAAKMQILVLLHHLVRRFSWRLLDPEEEITINPIPVPKKGVPIWLRRRS